MVSHCPKRSPYPPFFQFFHLRRIIRVIEFFIPTKEALGPRALKKIDLSTESG